MSNVRIILEGGSPSEQIVALALWHAKKARLDGMKHGYHRVTKLGDYTARIRLDDFGGDRVYLSYSASCPPLLYNGFVDTYHSTAHSAWLTDGEVPAEQIADEFRNHMLRNGDTNYDNAEVIPEGGIPDGYYQVAPVMSGLRSAEPVDATTPETDTSPPTVFQDYPKQKVVMPTAEDLWRKFFLEHLPTKYTGLMRKVLQATFAVGDWADRLTYATPDGSRKFLFDYHWGDSWGVILAPGKTGEFGTDYRLVRITLGEVFYVPAKFCVHKVVFGGKEVYAPIIGDVRRTEAVSLGLLGQYKGTSQFDIIGWSFSYKDQKASVILYDYELATPWVIHTERADIKFKFNLGGVLAGASMSTSGRERLFFSEKQAVHGMTNKVLGGDPVIYSLWSDLRNHPWGEGGGPSSSRAMLGVFFTEGGGEELARIGYQKSDKTRETFAGASTITVSSPSQAANYYDWVANDANALLSEGVGEVLTDGFAPHVVTTNSFSTPVPTPKIIDSRVKTEVFASGIVVIEAGNGFPHYNWAVDFSIREPYGTSGFRKVYTKDGVSSLCTESIGTSVRRDMASLCSYTPMPYDREVFILSYSSVTGYKSSSRSYRWRLLREYPVGGDYVLVPNQLTNAYGPGDYPGLALSVGPGYPAMPGAPSGYYTGTYLSYSGYTIPPKITALGYQLPNGTFTQSGTSSSKCTAVTSSGLITIDDQGFLEQALRYHDPRDENDNWTPVFSKSAFSNNYEVGVSIGTDVVHIGNKEYDVERLCNGWIGVV